MQISDLEEQIVQLTQQVADLQTAVQRRDSALLVEREDLKNAQVWAVAA